MDQNKLLPGAYYIGYNISFLENGKTEPSYTWQGDQSSVGSGPPTNIIKIVYGSELPVGEIIIAQGHMANLPEVLLKKKHIITAIFNHRSGEEAWKLENIPNRDETRIPNTIRNADQAMSYMRNLNKVLYFKVEDSSGDLVSFWAGGNCEPGQITVKGKYSDSPQEFEVTITVINNQPPTLRNPKARIMFLNSDAQVLAGMDGCGFNLSPFVIDPDGEKYIQQPKLDKDNDFKYRNWDIKPNSEPQFPINQRFVKSAGNVYLFLNPDDCAKPWIGSVTITDGIKPSQIQIEKF
jgi:hypothetical protein